MEQFREKWAEAGYPLPFSAPITADYRGGDSLPEIAWNKWKSLIVFEREHFIELGLATVGLGSKSPEGRIDPVGGTIGSLDQVFVEDAGDGWVKFSVYNRMGRSSFVRIPGTNRSFLQDKSRKETWTFGGNLDMIFYWWEPNPAASIH